MLKMNRFKLTANKIGKVAMFSSPKHNSPSPSSSRSKNTTASSSLYHRTVDSIDETDSDADSEKDNVMKLEDQLTNDKLKELEKMFEEADEDGGGGLDMDEFRKAMRKAMGDGLSDDDADKLFMKVDTNCDGAVDWDEYLSYMLLEYRGRDDMMTANLLRPFPQKGYIIPNINRHQKQHDTIVKIVFQPNVAKKESLYTLSGEGGRYLTISKSGVVNVWSIHLKHLRSHRIDALKSVSNKMLGAWVTDAVYMPNLNIYCVSLTSGNVVFYDLTVNTFNVLLTITDTEICITCMGYWFDNDDPSHAMLIWGDARGNIITWVFENCMQICFFHPALNRFFKPVQSMRDLMACPPCGVKIYRLAGIHDDFVLKVKYYPSMKKFMSCCRKKTKSLYMGDVCGKIATTHFDVSKGVFDFDYCSKNNIIITGSHDSIVRVWNPYVTSKPVMLLQGHNSSVIFVEILPKREQVVTVSEDKDIYVFDLNTQTCIQSILRKYIPVGPRRISSICLNTSRSCLLIGTNELCVLEKQSDVTLTENLLSHDTPLTTILYNPLFNQMVGGSTDSLICVWDASTGEKLIQFAVAVPERGGVQDKFCEITTMRFDPTLRRLITGTRDGKVKVWNFNNGAFLKELKQYDECEVSGIICPSHRIITAGWSKVIRTYMDCKDEEAENEDAVIWKQFHNDDITSLVFYPHSTVVSGSYDGDILVWNLETQHVTLKLNAHVSRHPASRLKQTQRKQIVRESDTNPNLGYSEHGAISTASKARDNVFSPVKLRLAESRNFPTKHGPKGETFKSLVQPKSPASASSGSTHSSDEHSNFDLTQWMAYNVRHRGSIAAPLPKAAPRKTSFPTIQRVSIPHTVQKFIQTTASVEDDIVPIKKDPVQQSSQDDLHADGHETDEDSQSNDNKSDDTDDSYQNDNGNNNADRNNYSLERNTSNNNKVKTFSRHGKSILPPIEKQKPSFHRDLKIYPLVQPIKDYTCSHLESCVNDNNNNVSPHAYKNPSTNNNNNFLEVTEDPERRPSSGCASIKLGGNKKSGRKLDLDTRNVGEDKEIFNDVKRYTRQSLAAQGRRESMAVPHKDPLSKSSHLISAAPLVNPDLIEEWLQKSEKKDKEVYVKYDKYLKRNESSIERLLILETRTSDHLTAVLVAASAQGWMRFWSIDHRGGLLGQFNACHQQNINCGVMITDEKNEVLITGDSLGYLKVWDISEYCINPSKAKPAFVRGDRYDRFTFLAEDEKLRRRAATQTKFNNPPECTDPTETWNAPPLLSTFRGHCQAITDMTYIIGKPWFASSSLDQSIRLWTIYGEFLGIFGQGTPWNILNHASVKPVSHKKRKPAMQDIDKWNWRVSSRKVPDDIRRVASATTLRVLYGGMRPHWKLVKHVLLVWLPRIKRARQKAEALQKELQKIKDSTVNPVQELSVKELTDPENTVKLSSEILGKNYKSMRKYQEIPTDMKIRQFQNLIDVYSAMPMQELEPLEDLASKMPQTVLEILEKHKNASILKKFRTKGNKAYDEVVKRNKILHAFRKNPAPGGKSPFTGVRSPNKTTGADSHAGSRCASPSGKTVRSGGCITCKDYRDPNDLNVPI